MTIKWHYIILTSSCEILVLIAYAQKSPLDSDPDVSNGAKGITFGLSTSKVCVCVHLHRLA